MVRHVHSRSWTVTSIYAAGAIAAGFLLPRLESRLLPGVIAPLSAPVAIAIYSSVASGMIALTGIVFSMTFVMVQFGANAYSPRLVLWFARDPLLAHAFGTFTATFIYAIAALSWVDRGGVAGAPLISAVTVFALLLASVGMFVGLINRVAMLQISRTLAFTGDQGRRVIDTIYPDLSLPRTDRAADMPDASSAATIVSHSGPPFAVEVVHIDRLIALATSHEAIVEVMVAAGDTVTAFMPLLRVFNARQPIDERKLLAAISLGPERTFEQDPKYAIRLLADIAIRALSPAVNDPTTAVQALDQIGDLLLRLGRRRIEIGTFRDVAGRLRVVMPFPTWEDFLLLAFGEISDYGASSLQVMRRMHALVADLIAILPAERRAALERWRVRLRGCVAEHFSDGEGRAMASREDRQGLGVSRRGAAMNSAVRELLTPVTTSSRADDTA